MAEMPPSSALQRLRAMLDIPLYVWCALFASLGGFVFGFDTGSIGSIVLMSQFNQRFGPLSETLQGLVVSTILLPAAAISLISGNIADRISRTRATALGAIVFSLGSWLSCFAGFAEPRLGMLFAGRAIAGLGEGLFLSVITVYCVEISPRAVRGKMGSTVQLLTVLGVLCGYCVCYGTEKIDGDLAWRIPFVLQGAICIILAAGTFWCLPHSPRWLLLVGRRDDAEATLARLGILHDEKTELLAYDDEQQLRDAEKKKQKPKGWWRKTVDGCKEVWKKEHRARTLLAIYMQGTQQLAGIDGVLYYAPLLFQKAGLTKTKAALLASAGAGVINVFFTIVSQIYSDSWGRRPTLIYGGLAMAVPMMLIGVIYSTPAASHKAGQDTIIVMIFLYFIAFVMTWGIHVRIHVSESQPVATRALVSSLGLSSNWIVNWTVAFTTPMFLKASPGGPYFLWGSSILVAVAVFVCFLQETQGKNLEEAAAVENMPWRLLWAKFRASRRRDNIDPSSGCQAGIDEEAAVAVGETNSELEDGAIEKIKLGE